MSQPPNLRALLVAHGRKPNFSACKLNRLKHFFFSLFIFYGGDTVPYLRVVRTPLIRRTPLGMYMGIPHDFVLESFTKLMEIDETTEMLLELCDGTRTRDDILHKLAEESGESVNDIADDVDAFVDYLAAEGFVEWTETPEYIEPVYKGTRPFSLTIALTFDCNLGCSFCAVNGGTPLQNELTMDDIVPLIEQVKKYKPTPFGLSGGEPLLKKEMVLYILKEVCSIKEMSVSILTNGTLVDRDYAHQLYDAGLQLARVSVDGHTASVHDALRGKGTFEKTMKGIKNLRDVGIHVDAVALLCHSNVPYLEEMRTFLGGIADSFVITPIYPMGKAVGSDLILDSEERLRVRLSGYTSEKIKTSITPRDACIVGLPLYIRPDGGIYPCFYLQVPEFKLGNIRENTLEEVYKTDLMHELLNIDISDIKECKECDLRYFCGGACRGAAFREAGSLYVPDPLDCNVYKTMATKIFENGEETTKKTLQNMVQATRALEH
jgi:radical SAM protein with 4Fe4S-binding SPASM domain